MLAVGLELGPETGVVNEVTNCVLRSSEVVGTAKVVGTMVDVGKVEEAEVTIADDLWTDEAEVEDARDAEEVVDVWIALDLWPKHYIKDLVSRLKTCN
jgi:hypothetical protein